MQTISQYLDQRDKLSFEAAPLNEVDLYILSKIGKPDFSGIIPEGFSPVPMKDTVDRYLEEHSADEAGLGVLASPEILEVIKRLPDTKRYGDITLTAFTKRISLETVEQFSALTLIMPDGTVVVTFAGTDDTLVAWKEDFMMAVDNAVHAQKDAVAYLELVAKNLPGKLIVAGHSKGGNLAVYAAAMASEDTRERISGIYNFDGPGFHHSFLSDPGYLSVLDRIHTILPRHSLVGVLMSRLEECTVVSCRKRGIASHDGFNWEVNGAEFKRVPALSRGSRAYEESVEHALKLMDREERLAFIEEFFSALESTGAVSIDDLTEHRLRQAASILSSLKTASNSKRFAAVVLGRMVRELSPLPLDAEEEEKEEEPASTACDGLRDGEFRKLLFIVNPVSGKRAVIKQIPEIVKTFQDGGYLCTVMMTEKAGDGTVFTEQYGPDHEMIVASGGDGSLNEIVTGLYRSNLNVPVGYIPCGSGNVFAAAHGIPSSIPKAAKGITTDRKHKFDIGSFNDECFVFTACFGAFSWLSYTTDQNLKNHLGNSAYLLDVVKDIGKVKSTYMKFVADGEVYEGDYLFGAVNNCDSVGGAFSLPKNTVDTSDGQMELLLVKNPKNHIEFSEMLKAIITQDYSNPLIGYIHFSTLDIYNPDQEEFALDGERSHGFSEIHVSVLPGYLEMIY